VHHVKHFQFFIHKLTQCHLH